MEAQAKPRPRRTLVTAIVVLATILTVPAALAVWVDRQALDTDTWTETSSELLEDEEIRNAVAAYLVDALFTNVDVQGELEQALPPDLSGLAGPAAGGLRELAGRLSQQLLQQPRVQLVWEKANRAAHETFIKVVDGDATEDESVNLDLGTIVEQVGEQAGVDVAGKIPEQDAQIEIVKPDELSTVQEAVSLLRGLALWLTVISLALFALAIYLARGWRREALRMIGFGFLVAGVVLLVVRALAGDVVVDSLSSTASVEPAVKNTWTIATSELSAEGSALVFYGILFILGAWLAKPTGAARTVRRRLAPILERRAVAYGALALLLILLFWWAPAEGFTHLGTSLILIALFVGGLEALRHITVREFPEETWERGTERWRSATRAQISRWRGTGEQ